MTNVEALEFAEKNPERKHEVIQHITVSIWAYKWVMQFPEDKDKLIQFINWTIHIDGWLERFPEDKEYFQKKGLLL